MPDEMPPIVTRLLADISDLESGVAKGEALVKGYRDSVTSALGGGKGVGEKFGKDIADGIQDAIPPGFTGGPGERIAKDLTDGIGRGVEDSAPAFQAKVRETLDKGSGPAKESGSKVGAAFGAAFDQDLGKRLTALRPEVASIMGGGGKDAGTAFAARFGEQAKTGITQGALLNALGPEVTDALAKASGDRTGFNFTEAMGGRVRGDLPGKVEAPIEDSGKKAGAKGGQAAGQGFAAGMSPLILGAFAAAASAGPGLILAGAATAVIGIEALATKGNAALTDNYRQLGTDASKALTDATGPLIPQMQASINILDAGVKQVAPELKATFAAVAPDATAITGGFVQLAEKVLPGVESGLRAIAPYSHEIADDLGKLGSGVGGLISGLGQGAAGGTAGFTALATGIEHLLPDIGAIVGDLSNGLGPALHDVVAVADAAGAGFKFFADNLPPGAIRGTADAVAILYAAFKVGTLTGAIAEGTKFTQWLGITKVEAAAAATEVEVLGAAETATAAKSGIMAAASGIGAKAIGGLGAAAELATGPLGLIVAGAGLLGHALGDKFAHDVTVSGAALTSAMQDAANGSATAQDQVTQLAGFLNDLPWGKGAAGIATFDQQLTQLAQTNPAQAAKEYTAVADAWGKQGKSASDVAGMLPGYTQSVKDAATANQQVGGAATAALTPVEAFNGALITNQQQLAQSAGQAGNNAVAALSFAGAQGTLNQQLAETIGDYSLASGAANAFKSAEDALYGKYATYSQAEATFTTDLANATGQLTKGKDAIDLHTAAGAKNFTQLNQLATANEQVAESLIKQGGSAADATASLQHGAQSIDDFARKAGFTDKQVQQLNVDLYGVPKVKDITFNANTGPAMTQVGNLIRYINSQTGTVTVVTQSGSGAGGGATYGRGGKQLFDLGGWVDAPSGSPVDAVVHGREYVLSTDMLAGRSRIDPAVVAALAARSATAPAAAASGGYGGGYSGATHVTNNYITVQGSLTRFNELMNDVRSNSLQYEARNSTNGLSIPA